ncbi:hypothetical protein Noda2021_04010 [Candidatus Dependentiae bacterium Noda2021]|nr:hypothetical protein Noda2021_04010 [Candidatus Dependentiae bacterium Noda2021]
MKKIFLVYCLAAIGTTTYSQEQEQVKQLQQILALNQQEQTHVQKALTYVRDYKIEEHKLNFIKEYKRKHIAARVITIASAITVAGSVGYFGYYNAKSFVTWLRTPKQVAVEAVKATVEEAGKPEYANGPEFKDLQGRVVKLEKVINGDDQNWFLEKAKSISFNVYSFIASSVITMYGQRLLGDILMAPGDLRWFCAQKTAIFQLLEALKLSAQELEESSIYDTDRITYHRACVLPLSKALAETMEKTIGFLEFKLSQMKPEHSAALGLDILPRYLEVYTNNLLSKIEYCMKSQSSAVISKDLQFLVDDFTAELTHALNKCMGI